MQPKSSPGKTNPPTLVGRMVSRPVNLPGTVRFEIRCVPSVQRHATPCNEVQPHATEIGGGENEPTADDFDFAAAARRKKSSPAEGEL